MNRKSLNKKDFDYDKKVPKNKINEIFDDENDGKFLNTNEVDGDDDGEYKSTINNNSSYKNSTNTSKLNNQKIEVTINKNDLPKNRKKDKDEGSTLEIINQKRNEDSNIDDNEDSEEIIISSEANPKDRKIFEKRNKKNNINNSKEESKPKQRLFFGPSEKEVYLQKKLDDLDASKNIIQGVSKGINQSNNCIHEYIIHNKLKVADDCKNVNDCIDLDRSKFKDELDDKYNPESRKLFLKLKQEEENIKNNVKKLDENLNLLENIGLKGVKNSIIETNIKNAEIKSTKKKKENLIKRLNQVNMELDNIVKQEKENKNLILKNYVDNFDKDLENSSNISKKYQLESKKILENLKNDLIVAQEKKQKNIEKEEKENLEKKQKILEERKEKEKQFLEKRKKELDIKMEITKQHINEKIQKTERDYLYYKFKENYEANEQRVLDKIKMQKKDPLVSKEEIIDLQKRIKKEQHLSEQQAKETTNKRKEMWKNRSDILPNYKNPITKKIEEEKLKKKEDDEKLEEQKKIINSNKKKFLESIQMPKIDNSLKLKREKRMHKINKDDIINTKNFNKQKADVYKNFYRHFKKRHNSFTKLENNSNLNEYISSNYQNVNYNSDSNMIILKKPKKFLIPKFSAHPKPEKPFDYLTEMRVKNNSAYNNDNFKTERIDNIKLLNDDDREVNILDNLFIAKSQNEALEDKLNQKRELMSINGGYSKNPQLGNEIGRLLVESIQNKLDILNAVKNRADTMN